MSRPMQAEQDQYEMEVRSANIVSVGRQEQSNQGYNDVCNYLQQIFFKLF